MTEHDDDILADLLLEWEELWRQGRDVPAAELCAAHPHLSGKLTLGIKALKATSWLDNRSDHSAGSNDPPLVGLHKARILGSRYRLDTLVAEGGFALVWKAYDLALLRIVAVKISKPGRLKSSEICLSEARRVAMISHPGIVAVHDVGRENGDCFIVSEFVQGGTLRDRIKGKPEPSRSVRWIAGIGEALHFAHEKGVVHRDIKPSNILIDDNDRALLADFGISWSPADFTTIVPGMGTLPYMSREQLEGREPDARSDIYSLGVVLHELLTGRLPYSSTDPAVLRKEIMVGATVGKLPARIRQIVSKALQNDPGSRYQTAEEMTADLRRLRIGRPTQSAVACALAVVLLLFGIAGFWLIPGKATFATKPQAGMEEGWLKVTAGLPANEKVKALKARLMELNPGFNGEVKATILDDEVRSLEFVTDRVADIQPVRALAGLKSLVCRGTITSKANGILADLSPLEGMKLTRLEVQHNQRIIDLSALEKMPLVRLNCAMTGVADLGPLADMPLEVLFCGATAVTDLSPLAGMKLRELHCNNTMIADLSPLAGMPLEDLRCHGTLIKSLVALRNAPLVGLDCHRTELTDIGPLVGTKRLAVLDVSSTGVTDFSPLKDMPNLKILRGDFDPRRDASLLHELKSLEWINKRPAAEMLGEMAQGQ